MERATCLTSRGERGGLEKANRQLGHPTPASEAGGTSNHNPMFQFFTSGFHLEDRAIKRR